MECIIRTSFLDKSRLPKVTKRQTFQHELNETEELAGDWPKKKWIKVKRKLIFDIRFSRISQINQNSSLLSCQPKPNGFLLSLSLQFFLGRSKRGRLENKTVVGWQLCASRKWRRRWLYFCVVSQDNEVALIHPLGLEEERLCEHKISCEPLLALMEKSSTFQTFSRTDCRDVDFHIVNNIFWSWFCNYRQYRTRRDQSFMLF